MERWAHKVLALFVVLIVIFIFTALPIKATGFFRRQGPRGVRVLAIINCFGGGVFFGAYLMHMSPEVKELLTEAWLDPEHIHFPMPELFMGIGFFMLLFVEKGISMLMTKNMSADSKHKESGNNDTTSVAQFKCSGPANLEVSPENEKGETNQNGKSGCANQGFCSNSDVQIYSIDDIPEKEKNFDSNTYDVSTNDSASVSNDNGGTLQSLILLAALSIDCVFEGMSLGLQRTTSGVWNLVIAILSHEVVIAFTLGLELFKVNSAKTTFIYAVLYSFTAPIGIAIGTIIVETGDPSTTVDIVSGIFQAMSAGVFIYCTFLEILPGQIGHNAKFFNIIAVFVGFGFMASTALLHDHSHGDDHDHDHDPVATTMAPFADAVDFVYDSFKKMYHS